MKLKSVKKCAGLILATLALGVSVGTLKAADNIVIGPKGTDTAPTGSDYGWVLNYGSAGGAVSFDTANPPPTGYTAGSIYMQNNFHGSGDDFLWTAQPQNQPWMGNTFDGTLYSSIELDFKYDTNSTILPTNAVYFTVALAPSYNADDNKVLTNFTSGSIVYDGGWHHLSIPINPATPGLSAVGGINFHCYTFANGTMNFWMANATLIARVVPVPPPTVYLSKVVPGLLQFADSTPNYNRDDVKTFTNGTPLVSWVGQPKPVVYSFKLSTFCTNQGFNFNLCLSPDAPASQTYPDPDWSATNAILLGISANGDGSQHVNFGYKTNQPVNNAMIGGSGNLTNFTYIGSAVGTWSLTFTSDTDATITAPDGTTYSASMPAASAALFADPACFYLFSGMGADANAGQFVTIDSLSITGVGTPISQDFKTGSLNPLLVLESQEYQYPWNTNPPNQFLLTTANGAYWHHWTLPDTYFAPIVTSNLASAVWQDEAYSSILVNGKQRWALVPPASLPGASAGFFALVQRTYSQLQVLLPGQTNAPGTALGYVGTPTPISLAAQGGTPTTVTVNACDSQWHIMTSIIDQVHLTTSDGGVPFLPADQSLANGTTSFSGANGILFQTTGPQTVTAQDMTSTTVTNAATSAPVTITN